MNNASFIYKKLNFSPEDLLRVLHGQEQGFLLESSLRDDCLGRYSFFGVDPFLILESKDGQAFISQEGSRRMAGSAPLKELRTLLNRYRLNTRRSCLAMPFVGGAVGYFSYDFGFSLETIERRTPDQERIPDFYLAFFDVAACIDHHKDKVLIFSSGFPEENPRLRRMRADIRLKGFLSLLQRSFHADKRLHRSCRPPASYPLFSNFSHTDYVKAVRRARRFIQAGDIYQINLSQRFRTQTDLSSEQLYANFKKVFPVPFGGIMRSEYGDIICGSPERFLKYDGHRVTTRPMKGTRPRSPDLSRDKKLRMQLVRSAKDKAELLMIVDLLRNDLGRVCDYGSVRVEQVRCVEEYSTVFQTTAQISGRLYRGMDRVDIIKACFPGGSITGCPKIRAMEIIENLEPQRRGIYTGALGYLSFNGQMDFNILIRSFFKRGGDISFGVGGGIVYDSVPEAEYQETLVKAEALRRALVYSNEIAHPQVSTVGPAVIGNCS